jgi:hypothetical protein
MTDQSPLINITQSAAPFDPVDLAAIAGGLQLMPENAGRYLRLPAFAHAVATLQPGEGKLRISAGRLRSIFRASPLGYGFIADSEDPFDYPFTESIAFEDGAYTVFPGNTSESTTFVLRHIAKVITANEAFSDPSFASKARSLITAALALSDAVVRRAGLVRGMEPTSEFRGPIIVPSSLELSRLKSAVSFQELELADLLSERGLGLGDLDSLVLAFGSVAVDDYRIADGPVVARPILRAGSRFVLVNPESLLSAVRHQVVLLATELGVKDEFASRYHRAVWDTAVAALRYMNYKPAVLMSDSSAVSPCFQDALLKFDTDKLVYVALVTDPLTDYNPDEVSGHWGAAGLGELAEARLRSVQRYTLSQQQPPNEMLTLFLSQGFGRYIMVGSGGGDPAVDSPLLGMAVEELDTIVQLEGGAPLTLWKFGRSSQRVRNELVLAPTSTLNEFYYYRERGYGYYLTDEETPDFIVLDEGGAGILRRELVGKRDWHAVPSHSGDRAVEVLTLHDTRAIPIYTSPDILKGTAEVLVEGLPLPVWIIQAPAAEVDSAVYVSYVNFIELIAYWLWQFTPSLCPPLAALASRHSQLVIQVYLHPGEAWQRRRQPKDQGAIDDAVRARPDSAGGVITIELQPSVTTAFYSADNGGERDFMRVILRAISELLPGQVGDELSEEAITTIIDLHAPLGHKKKILLLDPTYELDLDTRGVPRVRQLQKSDENELLDELGKHLRAKENLAVGPIPDDKRTALLQKVVEFYYVELQKLVSSLRPDGMLEWLVNYHEANVAATAVHKQSLPTRLACFGAVPEMLDVIEKEIPNDTNAALASRFVIEYTVARPPSGLRPMSLDVYDRLQALAILLVNFGFESDLIHFNLADIKMAMLPSGRLGVDRDLIKRAREAFLSAFTAGSIARSTRSFGRHWEASRNEGGTADASPEADLFERIDESAKVEFGHTITDLGKLMFYAAKFGQEIDLAVARLPLEELIGVLTDVLKWSREEVASALDLLSIGPRPNFLQPPAPHPNWSVLPWRFNRSYSYVRRPFLRRLDGDVTTVLWGPRHVYVAWMNLINLCLDGRLIEPRSRDMRELMGKINDRRGELFNTRVAELLERNARLIVRRNVEKAGDLSIATPLGPLGDIDVLVADPRRRRLIPIECKDLAVARTPHEMDNEITNLFRGRGRRKSYIEKHQNRVRWIQDHINEVLAWLGVPNAKKWRVDPLVVVDQELFTPFLQSSPIRVVSYQQLAEEQVGWG